jgi:hypothetical protein
VARTIIRKWGDDDRLDADALRVMDGQRDEVSSLIDDLDGLNDRDGGELLVSYGAYSKEFDPNVDPADRQVRSVDEVQADLRRLADADVDNLAEGIKSSTTSADGGSEIPTLKGLDGEADAATTLLDNPDVMVKRLEVRDITASVNGRAATSEIDIDAETADGRRIAVESKNRDYEDVPSAIPVRNTEINDLRNKFEVLSRSRETVVVVSRTEDPLSNEIIQTAIDDASFPNGFNREKDLIFVNYGDLNELR